MLSREILPTSAFRCRQLDPRLRLLGVVLNNVASDHHRRLIEDAIWGYATLPVLGALPAEAAAEAIELPASRLGADYEPDALEAILDASGRYPYFLQEWGSKVWDIAPGPDFTLEDVQVAGVEVEAALDQGFFAVRAERATETERKLMRAMAWLGEGPYRWAQVVDAFGGDLKTCSVLTDRLLKKGLVYRPRHAELDFTVPHFAPFIRRHYPTLRR